MNVINEHLIEQLQAKLDAIFSTFRTIKIDDQSIQIMPPKDQVPKIQSIELRPDEDSLVIYYTDKDKESLQKYSVTKNLIFLKDQEGVIQGIFLRGIKELHKLSLEKGRTDTIKKYNHVELPLIVAEDKERRTFDFLKDLIKNFEIFDRSLAAAV